jgi:hypothetical protein
MVPQRLHSQSACASARSTGVNGSLAPPPARGAVRHNLCASLEGRRDLCAGAVLSVLASCPELEETPPKTAPRHGNRDTA